MKGITRQLAIALEAVGCAAISVGVALEVVTGSDTGFIVITAGSLAVASGAMVFNKLIRRK